VDLADTYSDARGEGERLHEAIDIMAPAGTPVLAAGPGTIERLFFSEEGGNTIYVRSSNRQMLHYYAHLQDYAPGLREGQRVNQGQRLGTVGISGNADPATPHLHFAVLRTSSGSEWWEPGSALNPYRLLGGR
jgi:murein DD-endopeptidase MepM/ murein hydrolase activator NlpD